MLGHRVNSEGLRGRAIALGGGAPKRCYIVFGGRNCQPSDMRIRRLWIAERTAIFA